ncbi:MAG TPA: Mur ligase family protein, partial [Gemmatimonadaceae bacterium]
FPPDAPATIPIAAITGTNGKTTTARMVAHIMRTGGRHTGLATTTGVYVDGRQVARGDMTGPVSARMLLRDATVECAVLESARGGILREGLAFRRCTVGAVLNVTADHLGLGGIDTVEGLAEVKRIVAEVASELAVLNADDAFCLAMREHVSARRVCLVSMYADSSEIAAHVADGGMAVVFEHNVQALVVRDGGSRTYLLETADIPATLGGRVKFNMQNAAFAAAIALGLGASDDDVRAGLRSFQPDLTHSPGRMNVYDELPFRVIVDYGHNPAAVRATCEAAKHLGNGGRTIGVVAAPGDRRDDDIRAVAHAAASHCDIFIVRRDDDLRGRRADEVPLLLREGLLEAGVPADRILVVPAEPDAMLAGLAAAQPGDLLLLFTDNVYRTWQQIVSFTPGPAAESDQIWGSSGTRTRETARA